MADRPRKLADFKVVGHFKLIFDRRVTFRANIYGPLDSGMVII